MSEKRTSVGPELQAENRLKPNLDVELIRLRKPVTDSMHVNRAGYDNVYSNINSILVLRERGLELIINMIFRLRELMVTESNSPYYGFETVQKFQDEIDLTLVEISQICAELPLLPPNWIISVPSIVDTEKAGLLATTIDLRFLGFDKGIKVLPKYRDIFVHNKEALIAELERSESVEGRSNAMKKLESFDRALEKFTPAIERFITVCLENNVFPFNEGIYSAERLADELNKASEVSMADGLTRADIDLLSSASRNFGTFLEQVMQVMPLPVNLNIVETAYNRVSAELSEIIGIRNQIEWALRTKPISDQQLSSAEERFRVPNIASTPEQVYNIKSEEQLKSNKEEKDSINKSLGTGNSYDKNNSDATLLR